MEANELRIGNLFNAVATNGVETINIYKIKIFEIFIDGIREGNGLKFGFHNLVGIRLTEEWLLEFGFNYQDAKYWIDGLCIHTSDKDFYILQEQGRVFIKSVHQLQNLFFALKGEELIIKN